MTNRTAAPSRLRRDLRGIGEVLAFNGIRIPRVAFEPVLRDRTPDAGLFGPDSTAWRLLREPVLLVGGQRALLMQLADPLVAQAVIDHSDYRGDPYGRLLRTLRWVVTVVFGTEDEARRATRSVAAIHGRVRGRLPAERESPPYAGGTAYDARDTRLARWVLATVIHSSLITYETVVTPVSQADRDRYAREWIPVAELFGIARTECWDTWAELDSYVDTYVHALGSLGPSAREAADIVLHPDASLPVRPALSVPTFMSIGLLPPPLREAYGVTWTRNRERAHRTLARSLRAAHHLFPPPLRNSPFSVQARARVAGGPARHLPA